MPQVKEYFRYLRAQRCADLLGERYEDTLQAAEAQYGTQEAQTMGYRVCLSQENPNVAICVNPSETPLENNEECQRKEEFVPAMSKEETLSFFRAHALESMIPALEPYLTEWETYSKGKRFLLDFEVSNDEVLKSVSVIFSLTARKPERIDEFLDILVKEGLCPHSKAVAIGKWVRVFPQAEPFLQNDISHFSFQFCGMERPESVVVLRQSASCRHLWFNSYFRPHQMNLN